MGAYALWDRCWSAKSGQSLRVYVLLEAIYRIWHHNLADSQDTRYSRHTPEWLFDTFQLLKFGLRTSYLVAVISLSFTSAKTYELQLFFTGRIFEAQRPRFLELFSIILEVASHGTTSSLAFNQLCIALDPSC